MSEASPQTAEPAIGESSSDSSIVIDSEDLRSPGVSLKTTTTLAKLATRASGPVLDEPSVLQRGDSLGRYMVLEPLGAGGMGVVYAAYDPDLDRKVAVKLLRSELFVKPGERAARRLRREARALARLSHANIVTVYDIGTVGDQLFIAMELIDGFTLAQWDAAARAKGAQRPWREVLDHLVQAGQGLAAAHAAGVVHRDFKPGNVMIGDDGRVRVLDFGLATSGNLPEDDASANGTSTRDGDGTRGGPVDPAPGVSWSLRGVMGLPAGTPAYMAPEHAAGDPVDGRSDQFSFCCTLYEALYGTLPFAGETLLAYLSAVRSGAVREPPAGTPVPSWVWRAVARGLAVDPEARHPSMGALVALLERRPDAGRRRWLLAGALAALTAAGTWWRLQDRPSQLCRGAETRLAGIWDDERRGAMRAAFADSGVGYAAESTRETARLLDAYSRDWVAMRTEACEATHLRGEQSPRLLDLRMSCLDDRLRELRALTDLFSSADAAVVKNAVGAAGRLRRLEACADGDLLARVMPSPDVSTRDRVTRLRQEVARVQALRAAGKYDDGLGEARRIAAAAQGVGFAPLTAETRFELAELLRRRDLYDEAETALVEALHFAELGWHEAIRVETLLSMVWLADSRAQYDEGRRWLRVADGAIHRLEEPADLQHRWHHATARIELGTGNYRAAAAAARAALEGGEVLYGQDHPKIGRYLSTLALALMRQGLDAEALPHVERLAEIRRRALGAGHPNTGAADHALGSVLRRLGRLKEAEPALRRALDTCVSGFGPESSAVATVRSDLGTLMMNLGRFTEAREELTQALEIRRTSYGAEHQAVAKSLTLLGQAETHLGHFARAERTLHEALRMKRATAGARRSTIAYTLIDIGDLGVERGRYRAALDAYREARTIVDETLGSEHPLAGEIACGMAAAQTAQGRHDRAVEEIEAVLGTSGFRAPVLRARCGFTLARALWRQGDDRPRALELARQARDGFVALGRSGQPVHREVVAWLDTRERLATGTAGQQPETGG